MRGPPIPDTGRLARRRGSDRLAAAEHRPDSDGAGLKRALAKHRVLKQYQLGIGRRLTRAEMLQLNATGKVPAWARYDASASVPPPSAREP
jgi:hypothetical protein